MPTKKSFLVIVLTICLGSFICVQAGGTLEATIESTGTGSITADQIVYTIRIGVVNDTSAAEAYDLHNKKANKLSEILNTFKIPDDQIKYTLLSIRQSISAVKKVAEYRTEQHVIVTIKDLNMNQKLQIALIEAGIIDFRSDFSYSNPGALKNLAINNGMEEAEKKIKQVAQTVGFKNYRVKNIKINDQSAARYRDQMIPMSASGRGFEAIPQQVYSIVNLTVEYVLWNQL